MWFVIRSNRNLNVIEPSTEWMPVRLNTSGGKLRRMRVIWLRTTSINLSSSSMSRLSAPRVFHGKQFSAIETVGANVAPAPLGREQMGRTVTVRFPDTTNSLKLAVRSEH